MLAVRLVFRPRIGRSRVFNLPWSHSHRLFWCWPVVWNVAGITSSITFARAGARSVMTFVGVRCAAGDVVENLRAEAISLCWETSTSMTWPWHAVAVGPHRSAQE